MTAPPRAEEGAQDPTVLIDELERELGVTGTANVFRKALTIAKEAAAIARVRQETYAADQLVERLRSWGENDADPEFLTGDLLSSVLMDCGMGSEAIVAANLRASQAEAEVARLTERVAAIEAQNAYLREHDALAFVKAVAGGTNISDELRTAASRMVAAAAEVRNGTPGGTDAQ